MLADLQAKLESEYGMDAEKAKLFSEKFDQIATPREEFEWEEPQVEQPVSIGQLSFIASLEAELGEDGKKIINEYLTNVNKENVSDLTQIEAGALLGGLTAMQNNRDEEADATTRRFWGAVVLFNAVEIPLWGSLMAGMKGIGPLKNVIGPGSEALTAGEIAGITGSISLPAEATKQPGLLARLLTRLRGGGGAGGLGGTFVGSTPAFALLTPDPTITGRGGAGIPTQTAQAGLGAGLEVPVLTTTLGGRHGFLDPETGEFKIPRSGLLGLVLGPEVIPATEVQTLMEEEETAARGARIAEANRAAILRSGPRRGISAPGVVRFEKTRR